MSQEKRRRKSRKSDGRHRDARVTLRLTVEAVDLLDVESKRTGMTRGDVVLGLIESNLDGGQ